MKLFRPTPLSPRQIERRKKMQARTAPKVFTWPLSKGVIAEVKFTGGEVQPAHLDLLAKYLELAKSAIETEDEEQAQ
jgi:hypothetical protein